MPAVGKLVKAKNGMIWIPPYHPHWDWMGPYSRVEEAKEDLEGVLRTVGGIEWRMMMVELVDKFERKWNRLEKKKSSRVS